MVHNIDKSNFHNFLKSNNINYDELYQKKSEYYKQNIINNHIKYVGNIDIFLEKLKKKQKKLIMVTNSSIKSIDLLKISYPIINLFDKIYTKEDFTNKKPHPECYLKVQEIYKNSRMIGFEDSYQGMHALSQALNIKPIHIRPKNYYYNDFILDKNNIDMIDELFVNIKKINSIKKLTFLSKNIIEKNINLIESIKLANYLIKS